MAYRWTVASYFLSVLLYNRMVYEHGAKWLILFTNWNFFLLNMLCCLLAVFTTVHYYSPYTPNTGTCFFSQNRYTLGLLLFVLRDVEMTTNQNQWICNEVKQSEYFPPYKSDCQYSRIGPKCGSREPLLGLIFTLR